MTNETHIHPRPRRRRPCLGAAVTAAVIAALLLAACGSSSSSKSASSSASKTVQNGSPASRFASLRACLQKQGINFPSFAPHASKGSGPPGGGAPGGGFKLPKGVTRSRFQEAVKKCGGRAFSGGRRPGFNSARVKSALTKYAGCMRENGIKLPTPNTSGEGPVFDTKGIDTSSTTFKDAQRTCQSDLRGAFGAFGSANGGQGSPPQGGGEPPAGAGGPPPGAEGAAG